MHKPPKPPFKRQPDNVNEGIRFKEVLVIFPDGSKQLLATPNAIRRARELNLDLIVVSPTAQPPVAKVMDHGQYNYEQKKKQKAAKKNQHVQQLKELKFRPNTDDHDYDFKKKHAIEFLQDGNKVKAVIQFRGREITHADLGKDLLKRLVADLAGMGSVDGEPRFEGKNAHVIISPIKK